LGRAINATERTLFVALEWAEEGVKARAMAKAKCGVLRCAQNDNLRHKTAATPTTASTKTTAGANRTATATATTAATAATATTATTTATATATATALQMEMQSARANANVRVGWKVCASHPSR
jgi:hypothetical protein